MVVYLLQFWKFSVILMCLTQHEEEESSNQRTSKEEVLVLTMSSILFFGQSLLVLNWLVFFLIGQTCFCKRWFASSSWKSCQDVLVAQSQSSEPRQKQDIIRISREHKKNRLCLRRRRGASAVVQTVYCLTACIFGFIHENTYLRRKVWMVLLLLLLLSVLSAPPWRLFFRTRQKQKKRTTVDQIDPKMFVSRPRFSERIFLGRDRCTRKNRSLL